MFYSMFPLPRMDSQNQLQREIRLGVTSIFWMSFPTVAFFFAEIRGYSKLYDNISVSPSGERLPPHGLPRFQLTEIIQILVVLFWLNRSGPYTCFS